MGTVAAPLLTATSSGLLALLLTSPGAFRWTDAASITLTAAIFLFVAAVQLTFWAKRFDVSAAEMLAWWEDRDDEGRLDDLASDQRHYHRRFGVWASRASAAYDFGVLALLLSVVLMLVPHGDIGVARTAAVVLAAAGALVEMGWIASVWLRPAAFDGREEQDGPSE